MAETNQPVGSTDSPQAEVRSIEDRLLDAMGETPEQEEEAQEEVTESETEEVTEDSTEEEEQPEEAESEDDDLEELEINGEVWQVPKALKDGYMKDKDYRHKTQEVAEERKALQEQRLSYEQERQAFQQQVEAQKQNFEIHAKIAGLDQQIAQYQNIDWHQLGQQDPAKANELRWALSELKDSRNGLVQQAIYSQEQMTQAQEAARSKAIQENMAKLQQDIPDWNNELYGNLMQYAVSELGFPEQMVSNEIDARTWKMAYKAYQYDKLMASKPTVKNKVSTAPKIIKTSAKQPQQTTTQTLRKVIKTSKDKGVKNAAIQKLLEERF